MYQLAELGTVYQIKFETFFCKEEFFLLFTDNVIFVCNAQQNQHKPSIKRLPRIGAHPGISVKPSAKCLVDALPWKQTFGESHLFHLDLHLR